VSRFALQTNVISSGLRHLSALLIMLSCHAQAQLVRAVMARLLEGRSVQVHRTLEHA
jgi:hypothetical protein